MDHGIDRFQQGTHIVPLVRALDATSGDVLEIGAGEWSTPLLQRYCKAAGRELVSVEDQSVWATRFSDPFFGPCALMDYDLGLPLIAKKQWSVILVDHWPGERRTQDTLLFRDCGAIVLVHDAKQLRKEYAPLVAAWPYHRVEWDTLVLSQ